MSKIELTSGEAPVMVLFELMQMDRDDIRFTFSHIVEQQRKINVLMMENERLENRVKQLEDTYLHKTAKGCYP